MMERERAVAQQVETYNVSTREMIIVEGASYGITL